MERRAIPERPGQPGGTGLLYGTGPGGADPDAADQFHGADPALFGAAQEVRSDLALRHYADRIAGSAKGAANGPGACQWNLPWIAARHPLRAKRPLCRARLSDDLGGRALP